MILAAGQKLQSKLQKCFKNGSHIPRYLPLEKPMRRLARLKPVLAEQIFAVNELILKFVFFRDSIYAFKYKSFKPLLNYQRFG